MQSYGVHDYLLPHGVGGAYTAAWVTPEGAQWQGNNLFAILNPNSVAYDPDQAEDALIMCATIIKNDVLCLVNNQSVGNKFITSCRKDESEDAIVERISDAVECSLKDFDNAVFDFFIFINTKRHIVTVVEMSKKQDHQLLSLCSHDGAGSLGVIWTEEFLRLAGTIAGVENPDFGYMTVRFQPFVPVSEDIKQEREQFAWENYWREIN